MLPADLGSVSVEAVGGDPASAALRAATMAEGLLNNPYAAAFIPPQAKLAVTALRTGAKAAQKGGRFLRSLFGKKNKRQPATQKIAKHLHKCNCAATVDRAGRARRARRAAAQSQQGRRVYR